MPNWCNVEIEIRGRRKLLKKINKLLTQTNDKYSSIKEIDYNALFKLDKLNVALNKDDNVIYYANMICEEKKLKLNDIMEYGYKMIQENNSSYYNIHFAKSDCEVLNTIIDYYEAKENEKDHKTFEAGYILFSNLLPDNPLAFYREDIKKEFKFSEGAIINDDIDDWYSTRIHKRWGTKWEPEIYGMSFEGDLLTYSISTAWSPCTEFLLYLSDLYDVNITMRYDEPGVGFSGKQIIEDGECVESWYYEYTDNMIENIVNSYKYYWDDEMEAEELFYRVNDDIDMILDDYIDQELIDKYHTFDAIVKYDKGAQKELFKLLKKANIPKHLKKDFKYFFNNYYGRKVKLKRIK